MDVSTACILQLPSADGAYARLCKHVRTRHHNFSLMGICNSCYAFDNKIFRLVAFTQGTILGEGVASSFNFGTYSLIIVLNDTESTSC